MVGRRTLVAVSLAVAVLLSGCAATQESFSFSASPGTFSDSAVEEAGYDEIGTEELVINRTVTAAGSERQVTVTNYASTYLRNVTLAGQERTLAGAAVFTTPSISIVGNEFNPIADESNRELVQRATNRVEGQLDGQRIQDVEFVENRTMTVLGTETTVGVFSATTTVQGSEIELRILVTKVKHEGDFVLVAAAYPQALASDERPRAETLFANVEHEGDDN